MRSVSRLRPTVSSLPVSAVRRAPQPPPVGAANRESSIDVARGTAMLLVFLAHFSQELTLEGGPTGGLPLLLQQIGMVASPTFVMVSGLTLAFVLGRAGNVGMPSARLRVFDRALFILLVTHFALLITDVLLAPYQRGIRQFFITDMVALNLMVGLVLLPATRARTRLAIGATLYCLGWIMHVLWHPAAGGVAVAEEILTGPTPSHALDYGFPVLEWAGVFLLGTVLGESFVAARAPAARAAWGTRLIRVGAIAVLMAMTVKGLLLIPALHSAVAARPGLRELLSLFAKAPPSPVYLMFFGGLGVCVMGSATLLSVHGLAPKLTAWVAVLGRNSLFVFMLQSAVFRDLVARLPLEGHAWRWPFAFAGATLLIWSGARVWDRLGGNRWLTLGIGQLVTQGSPAARRS